jgi:hypothetical protein
MTRKCELIAPANRRERFPFRVFTYLFDIFSLAATVSRQSLSRSAPFARHNHYEEKSEMPEVWFQ